MRLLLLLCCTSAAVALRCYEGTVKTDSNLKTAEKECGGVSSYCIQKIDKKKDEMRRECSSFTDEHNMEEKCPMSGCHWQSSTETYCCCQFDNCNEWKTDGTEFKQGETVSAIQAPKVTKVINENVKPAVLKPPVVSIPTTEKPPKLNRKNSEITLE